ncbi:hypothetical protein BASA81_004461 [Batrachochytrium salamandrivorans]|nr:hypothetical protein BASA81_004461 [Batrachochytrium salamandrivorans]
MSSAPVMASNLGGMTPTTSSTTMTARRPSDDVSFSGDEVMSANFEPSTWIVCCGVLEKKRDGAWREGWAKRFFVLSKHALHYYITAKTDRQGYTPLLGEERGQIKLTDLLDCKFIGQDREFCFIQLDVKSVRKQNPSGMFQFSVDQVNLRTPVDSGQLWFNALKANVGGGGSGSPMSSSNSALLARAPSAVATVATAAAAEDAAKKRPLPLPTSSFTAAATRPPHPLLLDDFPPSAKVPVPVFLVLLVALPLIPELPLVYALLLDLVVCLAFVDLKKREMAYNALVRDAKLRLSIATKQSSSCAAQENGGEEDACAQGLSPTSAAAAGLDMSKQVHRAGSSLRLMSCAKPGQDYMAWCNGDASAFKVRIGPNYKKLGLKAPSLDSMYSIVGMDLLKSNEGKIFNCMSNSKLSFAHLCTYDDLALYQKAGVPKYFVVNSQIPNNSPSMFTEDKTDVGYSLVMYFECKPELIQSILNCAPPVPPAVKLLQDYCRDHSTNPDIRRRFKAMGMVEGLKEIGIPGVSSLIEKFQGKPAIINKVAAIYESKDKYAWFEVDVSIFDFPFVAKKALYALKDRTAEIRIKGAFTFQGETDEELPECLLGAVDICGLDFRQAKLVE